jgi:MFS family permease
MAVPSLAVSGPAPVSRAGRATMLAPLGVPAFRRAWTGLACNLFGDQAQAVVLAVVALDLVGTASGWGAVLAAQAVPRILLLLVGGLAADRLRSATILRAAGALDALALTALAALHATGRLALPHLYVFALACGVLAAFATPAAESLVPSLLPADLVRRGNALRSLAMNVGRFLAPPLATGLVALAGAAPALALTAAVFLSGATLFGRVPDRPRERRTAEPPLQQLRAGLSAARRDPLVGVPIAMLTVFNLGYSGATFVGIRRSRRSSSGPAPAGSGCSSGRWAPAPWSGRSAWARSRPCAIQGGSPSRRSSASVWG